MGNELSFCFFAGLFPGVLAAPTAEEPGGLVGRVHPSGRAVGDLAGLRQAESEQLTAGALGGALAMPSRRAKDLGEGPPKSSRRRKSLPANYNSAENTCEFAQSRMI